MILIAAIAVFLFAVMTLIIILFRVIFLDKRFMYCDDKNTIPMINGSIEGIANEVIVNTINNETAANEVTANTTDDNS